METFEKAFSDLKYTLKQTQQEFDKFKDDNDVEKNFTKGLSNDQRRNIFEYMKVLMTDTEWDTIDKSVLTSKEKIDTTYHLESIKNA